MQAKNGRNVRRVVGMTPLLLALLSTACSHAQVDTRGAADVRVDLAKYGLPTDFFKEDANTKCGGQIIGYRFVTWLDDENVVVGFNTSPNCRVVPDRKVDGLARLVVFTARGALKTERDIPYLADGNGEVVAEGEATAGPRSTLLFRIESVNLDPDGRNESKSGVLLLDANLRDVLRLDRFLEQTTFVSHALIFQDGFTISGPRNYSIVDGSPPTTSSHWREDWPVGTMDPNFGEQAVAYALCQQEVRPNEYVSTNVVYAGARRRCTLTVEKRDGKGWTTPLKPNGTAEIIGFLADGSVAGQVRSDETKAGELVVWGQDHPAELLPWIPRDYCGSVQSGTANMSRYIGLASKKCDGDSNQLFIFNRRSKTPIVNTVFRRNGRANLSPNGLRYASFEAGELRIYSLPPMP